MTRTDQLTTFLTSRSREALIRGIIWAFIGLLYAILFTTFAVVAEKWSLPVSAYFFAGIMAGTIGALMYSSMRLVVFMSMLLFPISIIYFVTSAGDVSLGGQLKVMIPAGLLIGAAYGKLSKGSRIGHADAKTLAGFSAGFLVGLAYLLVRALPGEVDIAWVVGVMSPLTGALYVMLVPIFIRLYHDLLPPVGDGALVGACVAIFISVCVFIMAGSIDMPMTGELIPEVASILELLPSTALGGVIGAGLAGIVSGLLLTDWQDL